MHRISQSLNKSEDETTTSATLFIKCASFEDAGNYSCNAVDVDSEEESSRTLVLDVGSK